MSPSTSVRQVVLGRLDEQLAVLVRRGAGVTFRERRLTQLLDLVGLEDGVLVDRELLAEERLDILRWKVGIGPVRRGRTIGHRATSSVCAQ
jgi:hypothetical protein